MYTKLALFVPACMLAAVGCSPQKYRVEGIVTFQDGAPVGNAVVEFVPESGTGTARGKTDRTGKFELSTAGNPGVSAGAYSVGVVQIVVLDGMQDHLRHSKKREIPKKYNNPATSGIEFSIPVAETITIVIGDDVVI